MEPALKDLTFSLKPGTCCAILGPTGSGKSTLLHLLSGILAHHHPGSVGDGRLIIGDQVYTPLPDQPLFPRVGLALQDPSVQISGIRETVVEELELTLETLGRDPSSHREAANRLLLQLGVAHLAGQKPTTLSGGETQRVALATILIANPDVILLDEPATALDYGAQVTLRRLLRSFRGSSTVIFTDTRIELALEVADRLILLEAGGIVFNGEKGEFLGQLPDFSELLPVQDWLEALRGTEHPGGRHHSRLAGIRRIAGIA